LYDKGVIMKKAAVIVGGILSIGLIFLLRRKAKAEPIVYGCPYCHLEFSTEAELLQHIEQEHPGAKSVEVISVGVGTPGHIGQSPTTAVWIQLGEVVPPSQGSFYCKSTAVKTDGTSFTKTTTRWLESHSFAGVSIGLPRPGLAYYTLEIYDEEGGVLLYSGNWNPEDIAGYY
jgi:hypothetical protein